MLNISTIAATLKEIIPYSETLSVFRLQLPENSGFSFQPGQFVMMSLPGLVDKSGRKIAKAYSIASSPSEKDTVETCAVRYQNGALSPRLFAAKKGDEVTITGPYGVFMLKEPVSPGTVLIAGGTGIAPLMSMLRLIYSRGYSGPLWLFYSVSSPEEFLYREELLRYKADNNLRLVVSTSNPDSGWEFEKGRVTDTFPKFAVAIDKDAQFYLCGPPLMVTDTVKMLEQLGFKKEHIHKEQW